MFVTRRLALVCGAWLMSCGASAAALDTLDACAAQAPAEARGIVALEARCPGLEPALRELGLADSLPEGWRDHLDASSLADLQSLTHRYLANPPAAPAVGGLSAILAQLANEQPKPTGSWWDSLWEWLRSWGATSEDNGTPWLDRLLERLTRSADLIRMGTYVLLAIAVVGAIAFVINELKVAGVLARSKPAWRPGDATPDTREKGAELRLADLDAASLRDQPAILLRLLVARLVDNGQLHAERNLTHHELTVKNGIPDAGNRSRFAQVAQLAEHVRYGNGEPDTAKAVAVIAAGRGLLLQIQTSGLAP